jgi:hypothetical protein
MLLALASAVILGSESLWTHVHILLSQIRDFPFRRLLRLAGSRWRYSIPPPHGLVSASQLSLASERATKESGGGSDRHSIGGGGTRNYISGFEGSQAVPACPSGIGNAYYRNFVVYNICDAGGAALVKLGLALGGLY